MRPPILWRVFNQLRRWSEDRQAKDGQYVQQLRRLYKKPAKVIQMNLCVVRGIVGERKRA